MQPKAWKFSSVYSAWFHSHINIITEEQEGTALNVQYENMGKLQDKVLALHSQLEPSPRVPVTHSFIEHKSH